MTSTTASTVSRAEHSHSLIRSLASVRFPRALAALIILVIAARMALPFFVLRYVNRTLDRMPGYHGHVQDIDIHLIRGAYSIQGLRLLKEDGKISVPFFSSPRIDLSVRWSALLNGAVVGELWLEKPSLNLVDGPSKEQEQLGAERGWREVVKDLFPLRFDRVTLQDGEIRFRNPYRSPEVNVGITSINAVARNLTNSEAVSESLVATVKGTGAAPGKAPVTLDVKFDPYAHTPTFDLNASVEKLDLVRLNDFLQAYAGFDVERGTFSLFAEVVSSQNQFKGYLKPLLEGVHAVSLEKDSGNPLRLAWEGIIGMVIELFENQGENQFGSKIPLSGSFNDPEIDLFAAIGSVLSNAFIEALVPGIEHSVAKGDPDE